MRTSAALGLLLALAAAPAASASTAGVQGATLSVTGATGERNRIVVRPQGASLRITDSGATLRPGAGCTASGRTVFCPAAGLRELVADLGNGNDRIDVARAVGLRGRLRGGTGDDTLAGGGGPDELDGGTGRDAVTYAARADGVTVTLGGGADDGAPGEGDQLVAVETVHGTSGADLLLGGPAAERLEGRPGGDRLDGGGGNDVLVGGLGDDAQAGGTGDDTLRSGTGPEGRDVLAGGPGNDRADFSPRRAGVVADPDGRDDDGARPGGALTAVGLVPAIALLASPERDTVMPDVERLRGGRADDVLAGGPAAAVVEGLAGTDVVSGGPAADILDGGAGFDRVLARDRSRDTVRCGTEADRAFADALDAPAADCEATSRSFAMGVAPLARTLADGVLPVRAVCPAQAAVRCVGSVRIVTVRRLRRSDGARRTVTLGAAQLNAPAGTPIELDVAISADGRAALERLGGRTRVRVVARGRDEAGPARAVAARLILRG